MKIKDMVKRTIASNIRRARIASNMTQAEAAERLGITAQAVSNFERGVNGIESSILLRMCEIYNTSMSDILGEESDQKEPPDQLVLTGVDKELYELLMQIPEEQKKLFLEMGRVFVNNLNKG
jgi:transcriptional regulator with XRE-family HTH domain